VQGRLGEALEPREFVEHGFCIKALPSCEKGGGFDYDPLLVRLDWRHKHSEVRKVEDGELILRESQMDPVVDVPIRRLVSMQYEVGSTESNGTVLRSIPGDWLLPFLHQRYDDTSGEGIEI
jgi:acetoacetate decarboxylase